MTKSTWPQEIEEGVPNKQQVSRDPVYAILVSLVRENTNDLPVPNLLYHTINIMHV